MLRAFEFRSSGTRGAGVVPMGYFLRTSVEELLCISILSCQCGAPSQRTLPVARGTGGNQMKLSDGKGETPTHLRPLHEDLRRSRGPERRGGGEKESARLGEKSTQKKRGGVCQRQVRTAVTTKLPN